MKKGIKLTLILSVAVLTSVTANAMFRGIGNAVGDVVSTSGRITTGALDMAKGTVGRATGVETESGLVRGPRRSRKYNRRMQDAPRAINKRGY